MEKGEMISGRDARADRGKRRTEVLMILTSNFLEFITSLVSKLESGLSYEHQHSFTTFKLRLKKF